MLTIHSTEAIRQIEAAIGYTFHDKRLLVQVLTRKTYLKIDPEAPDNEVLEFYGDTLMNYHVTNYFMAKYTHMLEDGLFFMRTVEQFTDLRSHYVCNRYLTERVKALGLARHLRAQNREAELRKDSEKAYADIFESLVGAIYLDSYQNDTLIRAFILRQLGIEPRRAPAEVEAFDYDALRTRPEEVFAVSEPVETDPAPIEVEEAVTEIEVEIPPALREPTPSEEVPDEVPILIDTVVEAIATEELIPAETASPAEEAREEAPAETVSKLTPDKTAEHTVPAGLTAKQDALATLCRTMGFEAPTYGETPPNAPNARPVAACTLRYKDAKGKLVKISLNDSGRTLAEATEKAAAKMLSKVEKLAADTSAKTEKAAKSKKTVRAAEVAPAIEEVIPAEEVIAPAEEIVLPMPEIVAPAEETAAPVEEIVLPVPEIVAPAEETAAPVEEIVLPVVEIVAPAEETAAPVEEIVLPVVEITAPAEETAAPVEEIVLPVAETVAPAEQIAAPAEAPVLDHEQPAAPAPAIPVTEADATETVKPKRKAPAKKKTAPKKQAEDTADTVKAEDAEPQVKDKPTKARSKPAKAKNSPAKKDEPTEEVAPAKTEDEPAKEAAPAKEDIKPAEEAKPTKAKKPATRKPRAKKEAPAEDKPTDTVSETKGE